MHVIVSIHAPARGATARDLITHTSRHVSIHAPARGATCRCHAQCCHRHGVSIHAPRAGSDLIAHVHALDPICVSIHAPARGATISCIFCRCHDLWFQSTLPRGERLDVDMGMQLRTSVSIHAPARGATDLHVTDCRVVLFQSTLPARGATTPTASSRRDRNVFQSTLPRGERPG